VARPRKEHVPGWALAIIFLVPAGYLAALSLIRDGHFDPAAYAEAAAPGTLPLLGRSILLASGASALALLLGGAAAVAFERREFPLRPILRAVALAPLLVPPVFLVAAWERLAAPGGVLAVLLPWWAEPGKPFPIRNVSFAAFLLGLAHSPLLFFFVSQGLRSVPRELVEAARLHASPPRVWLRIVLPLLLPSIAAGSGIVFTLSFLNYEVPRLLDVTTYPVLINIAYGALDDPGLAFAAASPAIALAIGLLLAAEAWSDRRGFALTGRESPEALGPEGRPGPAAWLVFGGWWAVSVVLPLAVLAWLAGPAATYVLAVRTDGGKVLSGALTALASAVAAAGLAAAALLPSAGRPGKWSLLLWIPLAVPGSLLGFALVRLLRSGPLFAVYDSPAVLVVAAVARFFPLAYFALAAHLRSVPRDAWEAAGLLGSWRSRWLGARLPLAAPGLATGAAAIALLSSAELSATVLLAVPGSEPLIVRIYNLLHYDPERDLLAALCLIHAASMVAVAGAVLGLGRLLRGPR
jgi:iron(III) transport system permease protein